MPSHLHESHILLFRNQPELAAELIARVLGVEVPTHHEARVFSADLTEVQPAEYRADLVVQLWNERCVFAIIVEVQLQEDERKWFTWPAYVSVLRAKLACPVCLLVVAADDAVAHWARQAVNLGGQHDFMPYVLGPSGVPLVLDEADARQNPELAVLSAMAHGRDRDVARAARIAIAAHAALAGLHPDRKTLYFDLVEYSLSEAARRALKQMPAQKYEYQSEFARKYVAEGVAQGLEQGRVALLSRLLALRFGALNPEVLGRLQRASIAELDAIGERLLTAQTLADALG